MSDISLDPRVRELEQNIAASRSLIADLEKQHTAATEEFEQERLQVNIEDATRQLKDWEFELHRLTSGRE
jgi:predicted  nucleic acid-binding Zn-ribbon protein